LLSLQAQASTTAFTPGMVVQHSIRIRPGTYYAPASSIPALTITGHDITVDLRGVTLVGDSDRTNPDRFAGRAIQIEGGRNITVRGATVRGYKIGLIANGITGLHLLDNDLSHNWKPRLYSGIEKESLVDWLDYHQNEMGEWLRYGAGIYLEDVHGGELKGNTVRQGMNGLLLTRSDSLRIWNNDFSYNSGLGVGLYRASDNVIMHNRIDYDVRGYSDGFFYRGQDSAGLLVYEQSCNNVVAFNSVTHGGDGLFLWAGQATMDDGQGGANDNLFYGNDFSFAPTNGMEATFSRNAFINNRVEGNWHGLWGGYSFESTIIGNQFARNIEAIAIEHGQDNRIAGNSFEGDTVAIHLWWSRVEPSDWGYPKFRDTRSRDYTILGNTFTGNHVALRLDNTQRARVEGNVFRDVDTVSRLTGDSTGWSLVPSSDGAAPVPVPSRFVVKPLPGGMNAMTPDAERRGRGGIIVDEWGPYDWQSPKLWPAGRSDANPMRLRVLGPAGTWRVASKDGVAALSSDAGRVGDTLTVTPAAGRENDYRVELEYRGAAITTTFGEHVPAGRAVPFGWSRFEPASRWHVKFVAWDSTAAPFGSAAAITRALAAPALATLDTNRLDLTWYGPPRRTIPQARVLTQAIDTVHLAPGRYVLRTIADDAIRVYLDGRLILDDWVPGESHVKEVPFTATGTHQLRVEHLQVDGWYELRVDIGRQ
jgi:parallel beta-helix repeat protein